MSARAQRDATIAQVEWIVNEVAAAVVTDVAHKALTNALSTVEEFGEDADFITQYDAWIGFAFAREQVGLSLDAVSLLLGSQSSTAVAVKRATVHLSGYVRFGQIKSACKTAALSINAAIEAIATMPEPDSDSTKFGAQT